MKGIHPVQLDAASEREQLGGPVVGKLVVDSRSVAVGRDEAGAPKDAELPSDRSGPLDQEF